MWNLVVTTAAVSCIIAANTDLSNYHSVLFVNGFTMEPNRVIRPKYYQLYALQDQTPQQQQEKHSPLFLTASQSLLDLDDFHDFNNHITMLNDNDGDNYIEEEEECIIPDHSAQRFSPALVRGVPLDVPTKKRNQALVHALKSFLFDTIYGTTSSKHTPVQVCYARFYALETIARTPYFAYLSVLHALETLGQWRRAEFLKLHFAEAWNEMHHLLILESVLHAPSFKDRFVAQHVAFGYYWLVVGLYLVNPALAYNLNQAVEEEAFATYSRFLVTHGDYLKSQPAPTVAIDYYTGQDLYMFDSMHHDDDYGAGSGSGSGGIVAVDATNTASDNPPPQEIPRQRRRPKCETLYDTFSNIRDDEAEHVKTMIYLQGECQSNSLLIASEEEEDNLSVVDDTFTTTTYSKTLLP